MAVSYFTLVLISTGMGGNPFLNFLLQSVVEIPAYILGRYLGECQLKILSINNIPNICTYLAPGDTYGRRFTNSTSFLISFFVCVPLIIFAAGKAKLK